MNACLMNTRADREEGRPTYFDLVAVAVACAQSLTGPQTTQHSPHLTTHGELSE